MANKYNIDVHKGHGLRPVKTRLKHQSESMWRIRTLSVLHCELSA
jgi:hypothetical protein